MRDNQMGPSHSNRFLSIVCRDMNQSDTNEEETKYSNTYHDIDDLMITSRTVS